MAITSRDVKDGDPAESLDAQLLVECHRNWKRNWGSFTHSKEDCLSAMLAPQKTRHSLRQACHQRNDDKVEAEHD